MLNQRVMSSPVCNSRLTSNLLTILVLSLGVHISGQSYGWYEGQDSFDGYEYYPASDAAVLPKENENFELLECSDYNGVPTTCTPMENCPQLRFIQKQQFCVSESYGFQGRRGPYVCCPNFSPVPARETFNRPTVRPTTTTSKYVNNHANSNRFQTTRPSFNRMTVRPDVELVSRGGIDADANAGCGLLEKDEVGRLGSRIRTVGRLQVLGAAIGGVSVASAAESPWTVAIGEYTSSGSVDWFCGGSLLTKFSVLTAAHCTKRRRPDVVRVGEVDLRRDTKLGEGKGQEIRVRSAAVHPGYHSPSTYSDVAVLTLQMPVDLNRPGGARTICLPPPTNADSVPSTSAEDTYVGQKAALTGWGHLFFGGDKSPVLQEVTVTVFKNEDCSRSYSAPSIAAGIKRSYPSGIISTQLCAGDRNGKKDACQGDSGGPLVVKGKDKKHTVIGVISSGIGCGSKQYPGVYARVSSFTNWIMKQIVV